MIGREKEKNTKRKKRKGEEKRISTKKRNRQKEKKSVLFPVLHCFCFFFDRRLKIILIFHVLAIFSKCFFKESKKAGNNWISVSFVLCFSETRKRKK